MTIRTIESFWNEYDADVVGRDTSEKDRALLHAAFQAGIRVVLAVTRYAEHHESVEARAAIMDGLWAENEAFRKSLLSRNETLQ